MPEWLFEQGIGEQRALLIADGDAVALRITRDSDGAQPGSILPAKLLSHDKRVGAIVTLPDGEEAILRHLPPRTSIGTTLLVEVLRSAIPERDLTKRAITRPAEDGALAHTATLLSTLESGPHPVRVLSGHGSDQLEAAGWSEILDSARSGITPFDGGTLRVSLTPAMTVIDVDGYADDLARKSARAVARLIDLLDLSGNIVIDFPATANKAERVAIGELIDAHAPHPFERTGVNGYGLLQLIRPRSRPSIAERVQFAPIESAALALLRHAERAVGAGPLTLTAHPLVTGWIEQRPPLVSELARRSGRQVVLASDAQCAIAAGHAQ